MDMKEIMEQRTFAVLGDTMNPEKYAYQIKNKLIGAGYQVWAVGKELRSINDLPEDPDIIDLCINPAKGLALLQENRRKFKCIVIQPGAESPELLDYLSRESLPYVEGCLLVGLSLYKKS